MGYRMNKEELFNILLGKEKWEVYHQFQKIEDMIKIDDSLYQYFDEIKDLLLSEKSHIRVRAFRLISLLAKYDKNNKVNDCLDLLLNVLDDDKPTALRQCFVSLDYLRIYKPELANKIKNKLLSIDYLKYSDSMSPLIKKDIDKLLEKL